MDAPDGKRLQAALQQSDTLEQARALLSPTRRRSRLV